MNRSQTTIIVPALLGLGPYAWRVWEDGVMPERFGHVQTFFSVSSTVVVPLIALIVVRRRSHWAAPAVAIVAATAVIQFGPALGGRILLLTLVPTALWARETGAIRIESPRWPEPRALWVSLVPLVVAAAVLVLDPPELRLASQWVVPLGLVTIALAMTLTIAASPALAHWLISVEDRVAHTSWSLVERAWPTARARVRRLHRSVIKMLSRPGERVHLVGAWFAEQGTRRGPEPESWEGTGDDAAIPAAHETGWWARAARFARPSVAPLFVWLLAVFTASRIQLGFYHLWTGRDLSAAQFTANPLLDTTGRVGWNSGDYWRIADHGYRLDEYLEAAFPGYALLARALAGATTLDINGAMVVISVVSGLAATVLFWHWTETKGLTDRQRATALAFFLTYPYCYLLFGIAYSDAMLVALVLGAFLLIERDHPVAAGVVGAMATFTRPNALPLIVGLVVYQLTARGAVRVRPAAARGTTRWGSEVRALALDGRALRPADLGVLLSILGVGTYAFWMWRHAGDPLYFFTVQEHYGHRPATDLATWVKTEFVNEPGAFLGHAGESANHALSALFLVGAIALLPALVRRLGWAYGAFAIGVVGIAWVGPNAFAPGGRYLLPAVPLYALLAGEALADRPRILWPLLLSFVAGSITLTVFFADPELWLQW